MDKKSDIIIIGGGIAGAGIAAFLSPQRRVIVLEQEAIPCYHTTGRSAAFFAETYGGPTIQPLTTASRQFLNTPPPNFSDRSFVLPRGALHVFRSHQMSKANNLLDQMKGVENICLISPSEIARMAPDIALSGFAGAIYDPQCSDLDVAALHQAYCCQLKKYGGQIITKARVMRIDRHKDGFCVQGPEGREFFSRQVVNAAGAWSDNIAQMAGLAPLGITPMRRTIVTTPALTAMKRPKDQPIIFDLDETCYFRPEGEGYLISPADETPDIPGDTQPQEEDIARAVWRFEHMTGLRVSRIKARWAGLRNFAPDRLPVIGPDPKDPDFFWSAGQGGWGIQTSPAWCALLADIILGQTPKLVIGDMKHINPQTFSPERLTKASSHITRYTG